MNSCVVKLCIFLFLTEEQNSTVVIATVGQSVVLLNSTQQDIMAALEKHWCRLDNADVCQPNTVMGPENGPRGDFQIQDTNSSFFVKKHNFEELPVRPKKSSMKKEANPKRSSMKKETDYVRVKPGEGTWSLDANCLGDDKEISTSSDDAFEELPVRPKRSSVKKEAGPKRSSMKKETDYVRVKPGGGTWSLDAYDFLKDRNMHGLAGKGEVGYTSKTKTDKKQGEVGAQSSSGRRDNNEDDDDYEVNYTRQFQGMKQAQGTGGRAVGSGDLPCMTHAIMVRAELGKSAEEGGGARLVGEVGVLGAHWAGMRKVTNFDLAMRVLIRSTFFCFSFCSSGLRGVLSSTSRVLVQPLTVSDERSLAEVTPAPGLELPPP
ncbi:hypothetical protein FQN60_009329, partial [Etheostoma spectabile]